MKLLIPLLVFVDILAYIWHGIVFSILWGWFMVPIFHLPELNVAQSIGILLIGSLMAYQFMERKEEEIPAMIAYQFVMPFISLFIGYICH